MPLLEVKKSSSPMADLNRQQCLELVNELTDTQVSNLLKLVQSDKAKSYLSSRTKFMVLKPFI
ncbi:MAG: hypothetical protein AAGF96_18860 [Bacteroidota bacterium]